MKSDSEKSSLRSNSEIIISETKIHFLIISVFHVVAFDLSHNMFGYNLGFCEAWALENQLCWN